MLCCSCNKTTMAKEKKKKVEPRVWGKNTVQLFCLWPWWLTDWRQLILHLQNHSFPDILQQADDLIVAEFGQVDAIHCFDVVTHIQLITSAKQRVALVELSSPWASLIIVPTLLSWINMQAQKAETAGSLPPRMRLVPKGRSAAEGGWDAQGSLSFTLTVCFPSPLLHLLLSLIFSPSLYRFYF